MSQRRYACLDMMLPRRPRLSLLKVGFISGISFLLLNVLMVRHHRLRFGFQPSIANAANSKQSSTDGFNGKGNLLFSTSRISNFSMTFNDLPRRFHVIDIKGHFSDITDSHINQFRCTASRTVPSFSLCLYDKQRDRYISARFLNEGIWEPEITEPFERALDSFPLATVIDVGANIGYYSFFAASKGHKVIAMEPQRENQRRFVAGAKLNGDWSERILLLGNALSDGHFNVSLSSNVDNQGNIMVLEKRRHRRFLDFARITDRGKKHESSNNCSIPTLALDDICHVISTSTAIIKIDIEQRR